MPNPVRQPKPQAIADKAIRALETHEQIAKFSDTHAEIDLQTAYGVTSFLRASFEARGEAIVGRKIGFTNYDMWKLYGVDAPIWGYCTDRTTSTLKPGTTLNARDFAEPRIEPEIIFGLKSAPDPAMDAPELLDCIDWLSLGYEVVQSIYPNWEFTAADTVIANALHGALLIGEKHAVSPRKTDWLRELAEFEVDLFCNGKLVQSGGGANVLNSPLLALRHLVQLLSTDEHNPPLTAGEIVSTGTLTLAMPVSAGQTWETKVRGAMLSGATLRF